jgi:superfamily II DNA or RNA helicase
MTNPMFVLTVYTHFFKLTQVKGQATPAIMAFSKRFLQMGYIRLPNGRTGVGPIKMFAASDKARSEFRFHINALEEFIDFLTQRGIHFTDYERRIHDLYDPDYIHLKMKPNWVLRDYQVPVVEYLTKNYNTDRSRFVDMQTGRGKAQKLTAPIKVPGGWIAMGDVKVGTVVSTPNGKTAKVNGIFPQGYQSLYKVTFSDGRWTECTKEHLWLVHSVYWTNGPKVLTTIDLMQRINRLDFSRYSVDLISPEEKADVDLPIDPYVLGAFLGDGCFRTSAHSKARPTFTSPDEFIVNKINSRLIPGYILKKMKDNREIHYALNRISSSPYPHHYVEQLEYMDLYNTSSSTKFIPIVYLEASAEQKLELLNGLLDTDGTIGKGGGISYTTVSKKLAEDVVYLVRSLGNLAHITSRYPHYNSNGEKRTGQLAYTILIRARCPDLMFTLPKKRSRTKVINQYSETLRARIASIELSDKDYCQCISLDSEEKLYITNDFIVTHNTLAATWAVTELKKRIVIMVRPLFIQKWCDDMVKMTNINPKDILVVQGNAHLKGLIDIANDPSFKYPVIIISNKTFQNYITKYELDPRGCIEEYDISPEDFYEHLRAGIRLVDEVHLDFHLNFKMDMYTNIPLTMALSATLLNDDEFIELMYKVMYPMQQRYLGGALDKYIDSYAIMYNHKSTMRISTMEYGSKTYSHHAFEKSILKNSFYMKSYFKLIDYIIEAGYVSDYKKGERLAIFVSSIHMATELTNHLKLKHPSLDVRRYVENDPYENLLDADIRITTILSAGTGHDIANLKMVLLTVAVSSSQANIQTLGRLRKSDKMPTRFYYLVDLNIPKHMQYHERKKKMLQHRAMSFKEFFYPDLLGG